MKSRVTLVEAHQAWYAAVNALFGQVTRYAKEELDRTITESATQRFVKVLTEPGKDRILGVTLVGDHAGEMLSELVLAMTQGLGLNKILGTIHAYPTWAEANRYAAGEWKKAHTPGWVCAWLSRYHTWRRGASHVRHAEKRPATRAAAGSTEPAGRGLGRGH